MNIKYTIKAGILSLILSACSGSSESPKSPKSPTQVDTPVDPLAKYQGIWLAPAYGKGLEIENSQLTLFDYTSDFCFIDEVLDELDEGDFAAALSLQNNDTELEQKLGYGANGFYAPGTIFGKEAVMPVACEQGFMPTADDSDYVANLEQDLSYFYQTFKEHSVSIELQQVDWEDMYLVAQQALAVNPTEIGLVESLIEMIEPLKDGHTGIGDELEISFPNKPYFTTLFVEEFLALNGLTEIENEAQNEAAYEYLVEQHDLLNNIITSYADNMSDITIAANDNLMWFQVDDIGYLQIAAMEGFSEDDNDEQELEILESALDQALSDLQYTKGLIVDVRRNMGGKDFISLAIASRFTDHQTLAYLKQARNGDDRTPLREVHISPRGNIQYLNPVILLTSTSTLSAAEVFSMTMTNLSHVDLIGETTQGEFSDILTKTLPSGINFGLSNEYYITADGDWLEGQGVPVDVELPAFDLTERQALEDLTLEAAFDLLNEVVNIQVN